MRKYIMTRYQPYSTALHYAPSDRKTCFSMYFPVLPRIYATFVGWYRYKMSRMSQI